MTHYATLGVNEKASADEIKIAFRKLAKEHHPDRGGNAETFQKINEAYETLSDNDKRAYYDHTLKNPQMQFNQHGFHFTHNFHNIDPFEHINEEFSRMFGFNFRTAHQVPRNRNIRIQVELEFLETLESSQKTIQYNLSNGTETITLDLPAGIQDNSVLEISGRGDNANSAVPRGHLEVIVKVKSHPHFIRIDDHILRELTIDCFQAIVGMELEIDTPRGKKLLFKIPAGTQSGTQFGINDEGFMRNNRTFGKLIIKVNVMIPTALTEAQIKLVKQIQQLKPINT
jgi:curved DNA-binding protein